MGDRERPRQESRSRDDARSQAQECRGKGPRVRGSGLVEGGFSDTGPWRAIAERLVESYAVNRDLLVLFDNNEIQSAKDFMKALGKRCDDASSFRALADTAIQGLPSDDKFAFTKAARFQEMSLFRDTISQDQLASCLHDLDNLGLKNEQRENAMKLANEIGSAKGFGTVDASLVLNGAPAIPLQPAMQVNEKPFHQEINNLVSRPFEFESPISQQSSMQSLSQQSLSQSVISADQSPRDHPDLTGFMIARDVQMRASGPAEKAMTSLERATLLGEGRESIQTPAPDIVPGVDGPIGQNKDHISSNGSPFGISGEGRQDPRIGSHTGSSMGEDAIERIKSFFANALGIERRQPLDRDDGSDFQGKGPSSSPPIKHVPFIKPQKLASEPATKTFALPLSPPEPLTFRLRGGRFVTAHSVAIRNDPAQEGQAVTKTAEKPFVPGRTSSGGIAEGRKPATGIQDRKAVPITASSDPEKTIRKNAKKEMAGIHAMNGAGARSDHKKAAASDRTGKEKTSQSSISRKYIGGATAKRLDARSGRGASEKERARRRKSSEAPSSGNSARSAVPKKGTLVRPSSRIILAKKGAAYGKDVKSGAKAAARRKKEKAARQRKVISDLAAYSSRKKTRRSPARK